MAAIAPSIWELDDVKKGILCQLFGGNSKVCEKTEGFSHSFPNSVLRSLASYTSEQSRGSYGMACAWFTLSDSVDVVLSAKGVHHHATQRTLVSSALTMIAHVFWSSEGG